MDIANQIFDKKPESASEKLALNRINSSIKYGVPLLVDLIEPYWKHDKAYQVTELCSYLHLYARVLDDAVDDALPVHRLNLLKIQPLFWNTVNQISLSFSEKSNGVSGLIQETIEAVIHEWQKCKIETWGTKNHHLLAAPLLLSSSISEFEQHKSYLSDFLFILQTKEEILQMRLENADHKMAMLNNIEKLTSDEWIHALNRGGWKTLADRIPLELEFIISHLNRGLQ